MALSTERSRTRLVQVLSPLFLRDRVSSAKIRFEDGVILMPHDDEVEDGSAHDARQSRLIEHQQVPEAPASSRIAAASSEKQALWSTFAPFAPLAAADLAKLPLGDETGL